MPCCRSTCAARSNARRRCCPRCRRHATGASLAHHGITANIVAPASVDTPLWQRLNPADGLRRGRMLAGIPMGRLAQPAMGLINYAVPTAELDAKVSELASGLLARGAFALAWTKRLANRHVVEQRNRVLDAGVGYEMVACPHHEKLGGSDPRTL